MDENQASPTKPFKRAATVENSLAYMGSIVSFFADAEQTGGGVAVMYGHALLGNEPPPHIHVYEHEMYYVLEGSSEFFVEGEEQSVLVGPGEFIFLPAGKAHAQYFRAPALRALLIASASGPHPVGMDSYFRQMAIGPASSMTPPENAFDLSYSTSELQRFSEIASANGITLLSPEQAAARLPNYPGFGANLTPENSNRAKQ